MNLMIARQLLGKYWPHALAVAALLLAGRFWSREKVRTVQAEELKRTVEAQSVSLTARTMELSQVRSELRREKDREVVTRTTARVVEGKVVHDVERVDRVRETETMDVDERRQREDLIEHLKAQLAETSVRAMRLEAESSRPRVGGFGISVGASVEGIGVQTPGRDNLRALVGPAFGGFAGPAFLLGSVTVGIPSSGDAIPFQAVLTVLP